MKTCESKDTFGLDALKFSERPDPPLQHGQVRIRIRAASLNYRDLVTVKHGGARATRLPLIPCSDGAGEVVEVGPGVTYRSEIELLASFSSIGSRGISGERS